MDLSHADRALAASFAGAQPFEPAAFVTVRISPTIANEYATRNPEGIPEEAYLTGRRSVSLESAKAMLSDAEYNSDKTAFDVGPYGMPLPIFNSYRALAKQLRAAIAEAAAA